MNSNKETMEVTAVDSDKIRDGITDPRISDAQIVAVTLFRKKGIISKTVDEKSVLVIETAETIDDVRKSLGDIGLKEIIKKESKEDIGLKEVSREELEEAA